MKSYILDVSPVPKPRMTQSDKWNQRPIVMKYRTFCDDLRLAIRDLELDVPDTFDIVFYLPIPKHRKKKINPGDPHQQTPDRDNLLKAFQDALFKSDAHIYDGRVAKYWADKGYIELII